MIPSRFLWTGDWLFSRRRGLGMPPGNSMRRKRKMRFLDVLIIHFS